MVGGDTNLFTRFSFRLRRGANTAVILQKPSLLGSSDPG